MLLILGLAFWAGGAYTCSSLQGRNQRNKMIVSCDFTNNSGGENQQPVVQQTSVIEQTVPVDQDVPLQQQSQNLNNEFDYRKSWKSWKSADLKIFNSIRYNFN